MEVQGVFDAWRHAAAQGVRGRAMRHVRGWAPWPTWPIRARYLVALVLEQWYVELGVRRWFRALERVEFLRVFTVFQ